jgi:hypothetical protein
MKATQFKNLWVTGQVLPSAKSLTHGDAGKTFYLNSTAEFETVLPAPKLGMKFEFVVKAAPSGASYVISSKGDTNIILGQIYTSDVNSATDCDFEITGADNINFADGAAVVGDKVQVVSDGTYWYAYGFCSVYNGITFTNHSSVSPSTSPSKSPSISPSPS